MPRLTKRLVDAAPTKHTPWFLWCGELPGFGVRVYPTGKRVYYADYYNAGGTRKRMSIGAHGKITTEEARKLAIAILGAVVKGDDPAEERTTNRRAVTVKELCDSYLAAAQHGTIMGKRRMPKKAGTLYTDRGRIARHIVPLLGSRRVRDLTAADIHKFIRDVASGKTATVEKTANLRGKAVVRGGLSTAARTAGLLGSILSFAVSEGIRPDNPAHGVQRPADRRRTRRLTSDEYRALGLALAMAERDSGPWQMIAAVRLLALTGARPGEIVDLKWSAIDHAGRCLRLADSKEGASIRPLGKPALDLLGTLKRTGDDPVFPAVRRGQTFGGLKGGWRRLMESADVQGATPHTLRHSFASVADDCGFTTATIGAMLGHSGGSVTSRYIHKLDPVLIAAADKVAATIDADLTRGGSDLATATWGPHEAQVFFKTLTRNGHGRPPEPDDEYLWRMALLCVENPAIGHSEAARRVATRCMPEHHSIEASIERLRKKYRPIAGQIEPAAAASYPFLRRVPWLGGDPTKTLFFGGDD